MICDQGYHDECGIFGIYRHPEAANMVYLGLYALQHRGQESAGILSSAGSEFKVFRGMGYVADVFSRDQLERLTGDAAIGHVRYSTQGGSSIVNAQPLRAMCWRGPLAVSHNGNLINAHRLRRELERKGSIFQTSCDSEVIVHLIAKSSEETFEGALADAVSRIEGAFSVVLLAQDKLIAVRDRFGFRPLALGRLNNSFVVSSETCALDLIGARYLREVDPGEMIIVDMNGMHSTTQAPSSFSGFCIFELIYFARPDSIMFGRSVYDIRKAMGRQLATEHPIDADYVIPVPDSGIGAAIGYSEASGVRFETGLIRNHYIGRTFIEPKQSIRDFGVKIKLNPIRSVFDGRRVVVVDDSIVRGTTSRKLVRMIRSAGAKEVHIRISSPPTIGSCRYGIDTPDSDELIAKTKTTSEICDHVEADSLGYLSLDGLISATGMKDTDFCTGCFSLNYPIKFNNNEASSS